MKRLVYIDNLKAFAIVLVVLGHAIQFINWGGYKTDVIFNLIYSFHMPLFMALSGCFFSSSLKLSFAEILKKKTITILWPAIIWSIPKLIIANGSKVDCLLYNVWFLKSVFICYILYYCLYKFLKKDVFVGIVVLITATFIPLSHLPGNLNAMLPFFFFGILIRKHIHILTKPKTSINVVLFLLYVTMFLFRPTDKMIDGVTKIGDTITICPYILYEYLYRMLMALIAVLLLMRMFYSIKFDNSFFSFWGKNTLAIYVMNVTFSDFLRHLPLPAMNDISLFTCIGFTVILQMILYSIIIKQVDKSKELKLLLFGKL